MTCVGLHVAEGEAATWGN